MTVKELLILIIATSLLMSIGSALSTDQEEIPIFIKLFKSGEVKEGKYVIVNSLQGYCSHYSKTLIGCAKPAKLIIFIKRSAVNHIGSETGYDIFTHEYLHLRCEAEDWEHNWHVGNAEKAVYITGNNYWKNCGYLIDIDINIQSEIEFEVKIPTKRK